jgi:pyruvate formate-lyase/glycerol dehydratase family glycyl radical enzyme
MTERIARMRQRILSSTRIVDSAKQEILKSSFARTIGEPDVIRYAMAEAHYLRQRAIEIRPDELIVGSTAKTTIESLGIGDEVFPEIQLRSKAIDLPSDLAPFFENGVLRGAGNHMTMDYDTILSIGIRGLIGRIEERLESLSKDEENDFEKRSFLESMRIYAEAVISFSSRYADLAGSMAERTSDAARRQELAEISEICKKVPAGPAESFHEACQSSYFVYFISPDAPGLVDRYLNPFYETDLANESINRDGAFELVETLWLKYLEGEGGGGLHQGSGRHVTIGGMDRSGAEGSNELTWLCLDATEELKIICPQVSLRCTARTSTELLERGVKALRSGTGHPTFSNDEAIVPSLQAIGVSPEDARSYSLSGCNEVIISGKGHMGSVEGFINMPKILEMVLGLETGLQNNVQMKTFETFESLKAAVLKAVSFVVSRAQDASELWDYERAKMFARFPMSSLVTFGCIDSALGYSAGGARYNFCNWDAIGTVNLADAIVAIKKLVFESKQLTLEQFVEVLRRDWNGNESLRQKVLNQVPHFGNDDDEVDALAAEIIHGMSDDLKKRIPFRGGEYTLGTLAGVENMHVVFGKQTGATPDGRKSEQPFADSLTAAHGRDKSGVTAVLNSISKMPSEVLPTSVTVNIKLDPSLLESDQGIKTVADLLQSYFNSGGIQLQLNMVDRETLLDAKKHPERYESLMVRVAGYSGRFVALDKDVQNEVIARTGHSLVCA